MKPLDLTPVWLRWPPRCPQGPVWQTWAPTMPTSLCGFCWPGALWGAVATDVNQGPLQRGAGDRPALWGGPPHGLPAV